MSEIEITSAPLLISIKWSPLPLCWNIVLPIPDPTIVTPFCVEVISTKSSVKVPLSTLIIDPHVAAEIAAPSVNFGVEALNPSLESLPTALHHVSPVVELSLT